MAWLKRAGVCCLLLLFGVGSAHYFFLFTFAPTGTAVIEAGARVLVFWEGESDWVEAVVLEVDEHKYAVLRYAALQDRIER